MIRSIHRGAAGAERPSGISLQVCLLPGMLAELKQIVGKLWPVLLVGPSLINIGNSYFTRPLQYERASLS